MKTPETKQQYNATGECPDHFKTFGRLVKKRWICAYCNQKLKKVKLLEPLKKGTAEDLKLF